MNLSTQKSFNIANNIFKSLIFFLFISTTFLLIPSTEALAKETSVDELFALSLEELLDAQISVATRYLMPLKKAPAIATVITDVEIRNMGARNIMDVLERIPGLGITRSYFSLWEIEIRGLKTSRSEKIKLMVDGHSMNYPVWGGAAWAYDNISLDQVKRIEVIRGPGSALYGSNAFSGIINVVTKNGEDIDGTTLSAKTGTYDTHQYNIAHGKKYGDVDVLAFATFRDAKSSDLQVDADLLGRSGTTDDWARSHEIGLKISWKELVFNFRNLKRANGPYIGVQYLLNDESDIDTDQYMIDLSYAHQLNDKTSIYSKAYLNHVDISLGWEIFPEGVAASLGYPGWGPNDSLKGIPSMNNKRLGAEIGTTYALTDKNLLTVGTVYEHIRHYNLGYYGNYNPLTYAYLGSMQDISSIAMWGKPALREIWALYLQDEWEVVKNVNLTAGVRYDQYNDFGSTTNSRVGLVWKLDERINLKLLYGEAFRAPNFEELYLINNPATMGNAGLSPENIRTYEAGIDYYPFEGMHIQLNGFYNMVENRIDLVAIGGGVSEFQNKGNATIYGIETEVQYKWNSSRIYTNYTYQYPKDDDLDARLADVPSNRFNIGLDTNWGKYLHANLHWQYAGKRYRAASDTRDALGSYSVVNSSVTFKNFLKALELQVSAYNVFDEDYFYPAPASTVQSDFPAQGRTFFVEARYTF
ncbi:TonB-dependent receptor plug domain-containing protein [Candidatus Omnitrophota bacterium]